MIDPTGREGVGPLAWLGIGLAHVIDQARQSPHLTVRINDHHFRSGLVAVQPIDNFGLAIPWMVHVHLVSGNIEMSALFPAVDGGAQ